MPYKYLFFDLDKTIYDFDVSTRITFEEIYRNFGLKQSGIHSLEGFMDIYNRINLELWDRYRAGDMTKETLRVERFRMALEAHGINNP
jgi:putative hydrolase of the HAD superfamily